MMNTMKTWIVILVAGSMMFAGCGDENNSDAADAGEGAEFVCDNVGANPEMSDLLNGELADDVEVIVKVPQHPGNPGPTDLP